MGWVSVVFGVLGWVWEVEAGVKEVKRPAGDNTTGMFLRYCDLHILTTFISDHFYILTTFICNSLHILYDLHIYHHIITTFIPDYLHNLILSYLPSHPYNRPILSSCPQVSACRTCAWVGIGSSSWCESLASCMTPRWPRPSATRLSGPTRWTTRCPTSVWEQARSVPPAPSPGFGRLSSTSSRRG